jgi:hypothetical protein
MQLGRDARGLNIPRLRFAGLGLAWFGVVGHLQAMINEVNTSWVLEVEESRL